MNMILDFKNVSIVGHYVKDRTRDAQFIIIRYRIQYYSFLGVNYSKFYFHALIKSLFFYSLRNNMFELADRLVGIYKTDNCTKSITINPSCFADGSEVAS
jgi:structural maintenance of chromosome 4